MILRIGVFNPDVHRPFFFHDTETTIDESALALPFDEFIKRYVEPALRQIRRGHRDLSFHQLLATVSVAFDYQQAKLHGKANYFGGLEQGQLDTAAEINLLVDNLRQI